MRFRFLSFQIRLCPTSPTAAFLPRQSPDAKHAPALCLRNGRHSDCTLRRNVRSTAALGADSSPQSFWVTIKAGSSKSPGLRERICIRLPTGRAGRALLLSPAVPRLCQ